MREMRTTAHQCIPGINACKIQGNACGHFCCIGICMRYVVVCGYVGCINKNSGENKFKITLTCRIILLVVFFSPLS